MPALLYGAPSWSAAAVAAVPKRGRGSSSCACMLKTFRPAALQSPTQALLGVASTKTTSSSGFGATASSQSSSFRHAAPRRYFHSCNVRKAEAGASEADFYRTLGVGKNATQQDIKAQFYKLSKRWHPDVNQGSEESKQKFQQVSEAYATLGHEGMRKQYDRQRSGSAFGTPRASRDGGMRYNSDNLQRRATASYAWEYQRRNAARAHKRANNPGARTDGAASASASASSSSRTHHQHGATGPSSAAMFERLAEQQRRREAAAAERQRKSGEQPLSAAAHEAQASGHIVRFIQVATVMGFMGYIVAYAVSERGSYANAKRRMA